MSCNHRSVQRLFLHFQALGRCKVLFSSPSDKASPLLEHCSSGKPVEFLESQQIPKNLFRHSLRITGYSLMFVLDQMMTPDGMLISTWPSSFFKLDTFANYLPTENVQGNCYLRFQTQSLRRYMRHHIWFLRSKLTPTICGTLSGDLEPLEEFSFPYVYIRLGTFKVRILLLSGLSPSKFWPNKCFKYPSLTIFKVITKLQMFDVFPMKNEALSTVLSAHQELTTILLLPELVPLTRDYRASWRDLWFGV